MSSCAGAVLVHRHPGTRLVRNKNSPHPATYNAPDSPAGRPRWPAGLPGRCPVSGGAPTGAQSPAECLVRPGRPTAGAARETAGPPSWRAGQRRQRALSHQAGLRLRLFPARWGMPVGDQQWKGSRLRRMRNEQALSAAEPAALGGCRRCRPCLLLRLPMPWTALLSAAHLLQGSHAAQEDGPAHEQQPQACQGQAPMGNSSCRSHGCWLAGSMRKRVWRQSRERPHHPLSSSSLAFMQASDGLHHCLLTSNL